MGIVVPCGNILTENGALLKYTAKPYGGKNVRKQ